MAPRGPGRRPGRQRRRTGSFLRDETGHFQGSNAPRSIHSLKPREERPYQEFHPDLDVSAKLLVITSSERSPPPNTQIETPPLSVVPQKRKAERPLTPIRSSSRHSVTKNGMNGAVNGEPFTPHTNGINGTQVATNGATDEIANDTPDTAMQEVTNALSVPLDERSPLQILRHNFAASLPMSRAETNITTVQDADFEVIAPFKNTPYIGRSMADVGYQESEYWSRPQESYIRFYGTDSLVHLI